MEISFDSEASTGINHPEAFRLMCPFAHMESVSNSLLSVWNTAELGLMELPRFFCKDIQRQREKTIGLCKPYCDGKTWQFSWNRGEATGPRPSWSKHIGQVTEPREDFLYFLGSSLAWESLPIRQCFGTSTGAQAPNQSTALSLSCAFLLCILTNCELSQRSQFSFWLIKGWTPISNWGTIQSQTHRMCPESSFAIARLPPRSSMWAEAEVETSRRPPKACSSANQNTHVRAHHTTARTTGWTYILISSSISLSKHSMTPQQAAERLVLESSSREKASVKIQPQECLYDTR